MLIRFKSVGLFADCRKEGRAEVARRVVQLLERKGVPFWVNEELAPHLALGADRAAGWDQLLRTDLIVAVGGDGTLLKVVSQVGPELMTPPVLGIKAGRLGFLTAASDRDAEEVLHGVLEGRCIIQERMMLRVERRCGEIVEATSVLNDAVISSHAEVPRLLHLKVLVDGIDAVTYRCDGLIFSTPTGSTAHALSAGGPIMDTELEAILVVPICPHTLSSRPWTIASARILEVRGAFDGQSIRVILDGQTTWKLEEGESVTISASRERFRLALPSRWNPFAVLREKLQWRGSVVEEAT